MNSTWRTLFFVGMVTLLNSAQAGLSGCDDLTGIPEFELVDFEAEIQPIFNDIPSFQVNSINRIEPGRPSLSYLFFKINCSNQLSGDRMPRDAPPLNLFDQALIRDWIKQILIFRNGFE